MSQTSNIEWTEATWNPVRGCTKVSPGCAHCYAETFAERFRGVKGHPYEQGFDLRLVPEKLPVPLRWKKPRRVFVNSMSDLFQDGVPVEYIDQVFAVMALAPEHTFQVLTKRAERMCAYMNSPHRHEAIVAAMDMPSWLPAGRRFPRIPENWPMPNVWLGVSVENQHFADERIPLLLQTPAAVRFISAEPLLEDTHIRPWLLATGQPGVCRDIDGHAWHEPGACPACRPALSWVIVGGESGHSARPFHVEWARSIVQQCKAAGLPVFVKQLGRFPIDDSNGTSFRMTMRSTKGGDPSEWPADLQVRQFPEMRPDAFLR